MTARQPSGKLNLKSLMGFSAGEKVLPWTCVVKRLLTGAVLYVREPDLCQDLHGAGV